MMSNECCTGFKGWCKSFTRIEAALAAVEAVLLVVLFTFLLFGILHLMACRHRGTFPTDDVGKSTDGYPSSNSDESYHSTPLYSDDESTSGVTLTDDGIKCTWHPKKKTEAIAHYYENVSYSILPDGTHPTPSMSTSVGESSSATNVTPTHDSTTLIDDLDVDEPPEDEKADSEYSSIVLALVKLNPPPVVFGCILTIITKHWTLTAASCIESIEEVESLDSFVVVEQLGSGVRAGVHAVADVQLHPQYQGLNRSYDVAALRTRTPLPAARAPLNVLLPRLLDYFLITIGEAFHIVGYGHFRWSGGSGVRQVCVWALPGAACGDAGWARRHLAPAAPAAACARTPGLCAGVRRGRGRACNYCAGAPLLRGRQLLGLQARGGCGGACEPALYVNLARLRPWILALALT